MTGTITSEEIKAFVEQNIESFHEKQLADLRKLKLREVLARRNPYLFKAKI
jgi:Type II restriction endonuclease EcoO109I